MGKLVNLWHKLIIRVLTSLGLGNMSDAVKYLVCERRALLVKRN